MRQKSRANGRWRTFDAPPSRLVVAGGRRACMPERGRLQLPPRPSPDVRGAILLPLATFSLPAWNSSSPHCAVPTHSCTHIRPTTNPSSEVPPSLPVLRRLRPTPQGPCLRWPSATRPKGSKGRARGVCGRPRWATFRFLSGLCCGAGRRRRCAQGDIPVRGENARAFGLIDIRGSFAQGVGRAARSHLCRGLFDRCLHRVGRATSRNASRNFPLL